ncbi:DUF4101 domain-containing protein [Euhalothece natronophila Z-M001]|uniref:DUF4101 domain-containing protein n=1 Tax=Euhalothece natronophila Z-M001 TaxID=522448 RepID=A0A5B8NLJ0_9CHRO|nr:ARC6/PARC6 family protein [Euhalothece natronophila]QDZ39886.1 DUF4101 domain-containing protein [Euhalothece natronophila Z-M001]
MDQDKIKRQNLISIGSIITGIIMIIFILNFNNPNLRGQFSSIFSNFGSDSGGSSTQNRSSDSSSSSEEDSRPQNGQISQQEKSSLSDQEAVALIERWQNSKQQIFAPPYNRRLASRILTGEAYTDNSGAIDWLEDNGGYYTYNLTSIEDTSNFYQNGNSGHIEVVVREQRTLCMNGRPSQDDNTIDDKRLVRYNLRNERGEWRISSYDTQNVINQRSNPNKSCEL